MNWIGSKEYGGLVYRSGTVAARELKAGRVNSNFVVLWLGVILSAAVFQAELRISYWPNLWEIPHAAEVRRGFGMTPLWLSHAILFAYLAGPARPA